MKLKELEYMIELIKQHNSKADDLNVAVVCINPSVGGRYMNPVENVNVGFDWESGTLVLTTKERVKAIKDKK